MIGIPNGLRAPALCLSRGILVALAVLIAAGTKLVNAATQEVVFNVGDNAVISWFVIDNPSIHGTLNVTNAPYPSTSSLNAAAVDIGRNRLIYDTARIASPEGYAISLAGLQLIPNASTNVTVTDLGAWPGNTPAAGYRKADGGIYYHAEGSDQLNRLNFDANGLITGSTVIGNLNGSNIPNSIGSGDMDFSSDGSIWVSGEFGPNMLWHFDFTTLNTLAADSVNYLYRGIAFNAAGDTLYGYESFTGQYGTINMTTGAFQSVLTTDTTLFTGFGDLATGTNMTIAPEPASLSLLALAALPLIRRRRHA